MVQLPIIVQEFGTTLDFQHCSECIQERLRIVGSLRVVDKAYLSIDKDRTVTETVTVTVEGIDSINEYSILVTPSAALPEHVD